MPQIQLKDTSPGWRNGRRGGLKILCPYGRAGSNPAPGTNKLAWQGKHKPTAKRSEKNSVAGEDRKD